MGPYTSGGFAPVRVERDLDTLILDGDWPQGLTGSLYRVGPNPRYPPIEPYNPLMGDGMVHAFHVRAGAVAYRNRWVRTRQWQLEDEAGRALFATSGDPRANDPAVAGIETDGVANTNLLRHAGRLLALEEGHAPIAVDPLTLETHGVWRFGGRLAHNMTAHPKVDPLTGELVFFANEPERRFTGSVRCYVAEANGHIAFEREVVTPFPSVIHDFAVTRDFIVLLVCPVVISLARTRAGGPPLAWEPDRAVHVGVLRRDGRGGVRWLETDACFVWHVLNAFNEGDRITIDLCEQAAPAFPLADGSRTRQTDWAQHFACWTFSVSADGLDRQRRSDLVCEYPRLDDRYAMTDARHGFFACHGGPGTDDLFHRGIAHFDQHDGCMHAYHFGAAQAVSEPVFVPRTAAAEEGDGWLLCVVYEERVDRSHLAVLEATDVTAGPVARAMLPWRVPMGFHGLWVPT